MSASIQGTLFTMEIPAQSFWVWVSPGAKQSEVLGWVQHQDRTVLKMRVSAKAENGKANTDVLELLGAWFKRPKTSFTIESGHTFKLKRIEYSCVK